MRRRRRTEKGKERRGERLKGGGGGELPCGREALVQALARGKECE